jgi:SAM-dependent methyltransferase
LSLKKLNNSPSLAYGDVLRDKYARIRFEICLKLLSTYIKNYPKVLDIGCYTADLLKLLPVSVDYYGIDSDENALKIAHERGAKISKIDLENEEIPLDQKFDIIIITELLEHLKDPEKLILQIKHLLKENGVVLISLPNECTLYHRLKVLIGKGIDGTGFSPHYHLHFPTIKQNVEFLEKHFKILKKGYWYHLGVGGKLEKLISKIPDRFWKILANLYPSLFARGGVYLCRLDK